MAKEIVPGSMFEFALWADGTEKPEVLAQFDADVNEAFANVAARHNVVLGPVKRSTKRPGEDRVPDVPKRLQGPDVRLLVAEAQVICTAPANSNNLFLSELEPKDLRRLRVITRAAYAKVFPKAKPLTDRQCDTLVSDLGPDAALDTLRGQEPDVLRVLK